MRAYEIIVPKLGDQGNHHIRFAGSQSDASKARTAMMEEYGVSRASVNINEIDVPTGKVELLGFLNQLADSL